MKKKHHPTTLRFVRRSLPGLGLRSVPELAGYLTTHGMSTLNPHTFVAFFPPLHFPPTGPYLLSSEPTAKGTGLEESAGKEDPVELDSNLTL